MRLLVSHIIGLVISITGYGQTSFPGDPDEAKIVYDDIDRFWKAFDTVSPEDGSNPFEEYIINGSTGLKDFIPYRIISADSLRRKVIKGSAKYESIRQSSYRVIEKEKQIRAIFHELKLLYPKAVFPPTYFVIGRFNSGGTSTSNGLIIGVEVQERIDNIPYAVAHELIHYQQKFPDRELTLLEMSIIEGSADFLGELISGEHTNTSAHTYGEKNSDRLIIEFAAAMNNFEYKDWLYGTSKKDDRPNDLGYWIGYKITQEYFKKSGDPKKAIDKIINITGYNEFLAESGFFNKYMEK